MGMGVPVLVSAAFAWFLAGALKVILHRILEKKWTLRLIFAMGGLPSSHSAFVIAAALAAGLFGGFDSIEFALALVLATVVMVDAVGVRREAGRHAQRINMIIDEIFKRHPISPDQLREVLGHSPFEVASGGLTGIVCALLVRLWWRM
jgi:acid phosphatase family membrane protein YuiD